MKLIKAAGSTLLAGSGFVSSLTVSNKTTKPTIRLVAPNGIGQRGRTAASTTFKIGIARFSAVLSFWVGSGFVAIHLGKIGEGRPAII